MTILLVTGRNAAGAVIRTAKSLSTPARVIVSPVDVASFLTPEAILSSMKGIDKKTCSLIIVPGTVKGDVSIVPGYYASKAQGASTTFRPSWRNTLQE
jgi:hypothetical protein